MGKILLVFLCVFSVVLCDLSQPNPTSSQNLNRVEREIPKGFEKRMEELEQFREEFKHFKSSVVDLSAAFVRFHQSLTKNGTGTGGNEAVINPAPQSITSCSVAMEILPSPRSQKQRIYPHGNSKSVEALCDFDVDGGGWTVIHQRTSGPKEEFYQDWAQYKNGFGSLSGNFWMGLDNIRALTKNGDQELRIEMEDFRGSKAWAKYSRFSISDASDNYRLAIGGYYGDSTAGDSMTGLFNINGAKFSTKDKDNDDGGTNCAQWRHGAWWYKNVDVHCAHSNLNGWYWQAGEFYEHGDGLVWESWRGKFGSLKKVQMKIRKRN